MSEATPHDSRIASLVSDQAERACGEVYTWMAPAGAVEAIQHLRTQF
jgi:hypothetical protein